MTETRTLTHLQRLEAEAIHIMREVVAEAEKPVLMYSVGKDSAVMLHLARKAFYPSPPPFPLLHVDTTWKFREMYAMRDRMAAESGMDLIVHRNAEAAARAIAPKILPGACVIVESTSPVGTTERVAAIISELRPDLGGCIAGLWHQGGLLGTARGQNQASAFGLLVQGKPHDQSALDGPECTRQRKLACKLVVRQLAGIDLAAGGQDAQSNGQIESARIFGQIGRRQVHRDALVVRKVQAAVLQG